jgi:type 1 glutamine amidotransferase
MRGMGGIRIPLEIPAAHVTSRFMHMKRSLALAALLCSSLVLISSPAQAAEKLNVLVVTGGHPFEKGPFFELFKTNTALACQFVEHPNVDPSFATSNKYDAIVLYDYNQDISDAGKTNFLAQLKAGTGLVILHHAIVAFPRWDEYRNILGAHYYMAKTNLNGVEKPRSAYKHGVDFTIKVADPNHPVTRGVQDYQIHDETYNLFDVYEDCHPLLTTDEPLSNKVIGWAKTYGNARVFFMQSGHDHFAFYNPAFQRVLDQAIRWTARKD